MTEPTEPAPDAVCPECNSEVLPTQYCMMGHWCGEPVVPTVNARDTPILAMSHQEIYDMRRAMNTYGGSFVKAIAEAFAVADGRNTQRLLEAFPDYVKQYSAMAKNDRNKTA